MKKIVKKFSKIMLLAMLMCVLVVGIDSQAAVYGGSYSFSLEAGGAGQPGISSAVTKQTNYNYAKLFVNSYIVNGSSGNYYYTMARVTGDYYNTGYKNFCTTSSYNIYYYASNTCHSGGNYTLNMLTASDNPYQTRVSGTWTP